MSFGKISYYYCYIITRIIVTIFVIIVIIIDANACNRENIMNQSKLQPRPPQPQDIGGDWFTIVCKKWQMSHHLEKYFAGNSQKCPPPGATEDFPDGFVLEISSQFIGSENKY